MPFSQSWFNLDSSDAKYVLQSARLLIGLLLVAICVNVAILVYARITTRQSEIAVRAALGASRPRIVSQLFGEAVVLSALGAAVGLLIVGLIASRFESMLGQLGVRALPFWLRFDVSGRTLVWLLTLGLIGAFIVGVVPAVRLTGRRAQLALQQLTGGHATVRMGRTWTFLVIVEVAIAVAILPTTVRVAVDWFRSATSGPGFPAERYLSASLSLERSNSVLRNSDDAHAFRARFAHARAGLTRRLEAEREVLAVTFASAVPGSEDGRKLELESMTASDSTRLAEDSAKAVAEGLAPSRAGFYVAPEARSAIVELNYFTTFGVRIRNGHGFVSADSSTNRVIVNRSFVDSAFDGHSALGRRFRTVQIDRDDTKYGPWLEVIGVVDDFPSTPRFDNSRPAFYRLATASEMYPVTVMLRTRGDPADFGRRLRAMALGVDPGLLVRDISPLDAVIKAAYLPLKWLAVALGAITLSVLILSAAGIYALMSVTVTQQRREIGIRVALGASRGRLLRGVFVRASIQLGAGVVAGIGIAAALNSWSGGELLGAWSVVILPAVSLAAVCIGILASMLPAQRALSIQPSVVLKED
jgi:hypothetical protein